jgi:hypothetical protein
MLIVSGISHPFANNTIVLGSQAKGFWMPAPEKVPGAKTVQ